MVVEVTRTTNLGETMVVASPLPFTWLGEKHNIQLDYLNGCF
jgi:hypothetical protein